MSTNKIFEDENPLPYPTGDEDDSFGRSANVHARLGHLVVCPIKEDDEIFAPPVGAAVLLLPSCVFGNQMLGEIAEVLWYYKHSNTWNIRIKDDKWRRYARVMFDPTSPDEWVEVPFEGMNWSAKVRPS